MKTKESYMRFSPKTVDCFMGTMDYKCCACGTTVLPQNTDEHFRTCIISKMRESLHEKNNKKLTE